MNNNGSLLPLLSLAAASLVSISVLEEVTEARMAETAAEFADSEDYRRLLRHDFPSVPMNDEEAVEEKEAPTPVRSVEIGPPMSFGDERREPAAPPSWSEETTGGHIPEGLTLDPNWDAVLADPARTEPALPPYRESMPEWRCDGWMNLARQVGWAEEELPKLSYTLYRETRCRPDQHNPDDPMGGSNGLMQINQFWCKPTRYWPGGWLQAHDVLDHCDELYDPETNLRAGLAIRNNSGWTPWGFRK